MTARPGAISRKLCGFSGRSVGGTRREWTTCRRRLISVKRGELKGEDLATAQRILDERGISGGM